MVKSAAKECPPGKVINPETGRCVSEKYLLSMKKSPAKKSAAKKAAKSPAKKSAAKKSAAKKAAKSPAKKSAAKKAAKSPAKKSAARKSAARKSAARKSAARKSAARKSAARKSAARKSARKSAARKSPARKSAARKSAARKSAAKKSAADSGLKGCTKEGAVCKEGTVCNAETARCGKKTAAMEKMSVLKIGDHEIYGQEQELTRLQKLLGGTIKKTSTSAAKKSATRRSAAAATKSPARKSPAAAARKSAARKSPAKKSAPETCFDVPCPKGEVCSASTKKCIKRVAKEHKYLVLDNGNVIVGKEDRLLEVQEQYGGEIHDTNPEAKETQAKKSSPKKSSPSPKKSSPKKSSPKKSRPNVIVEDVDEDAERADESPQAKPKASKATSQEPDVVAARKKLAEGFEKCLASL